MIGKASPQNQINVLDGTNTSRLLLTRSAEKIIFFSEGEALDFVGERQTDLVVAL